MSIMQRMTLIGLYNYEQQYERDLFRNLTLPDGFDKTIFINSLLLEHGEKCVLYTNPDFFINAIGVWSVKYSLELERIYQALTAEYNPIWNYDRNEEWSDAGGRESTSETSGGRKSTSETSGRSEHASEMASNEESNASHKAKDTPDFDVTQESITDAVTENQISADNSSSYQPESKTTQNGGKTSTGTSGTTQDLAELSDSKTTNTTTSGDTSSNIAKTVDSSEDSATTSDNMAESSKHTGHLWGNIGVTTSASMVTEVVKQRFELSLYGTACKMFANELLLGIY